MTGYRNPVIPGFHPDPNTEMTGGFLGRIIGLYAVGGDAAVDWFDYEEVP